MKRGQGDVPADRRTFRLALPARNATAWALSLALAWATCLPAHAQSGSGPTREGPGSDHPTPPLSASVQRAVSQRLASDKRIASARLGVEVSNGIVQLSGKVPVPPWRERASRVAGAVQGVRAVVNRIRVEPVRRPDHLVARDARAAVRDTAALALLPITVDVNNGVITLRGFITTWEEQQLAERVVGSVPGVRFCQNQLTWTATITRTSAIIAGDIQSRLDSDPFVRDARISVSARAGRVTLTGTATSSAQRRRAIKLAWVRGVKAVDSRALDLDDSGRADRNVRDSLPTDQEISTAIRDLAAYWPPVAAAATSTAVAAGVVTLRGTVKTVAEKRSLEAMAASAVGVVEVRSELRGPWWSPPAAPAPPRPIVRDAARKSRKAR